VAAVAGRKPFLSNEFEHSRCAVQANRLNLASGSLFVSWHSLARSALMIAADDIRRVKKKRMRARANIALPQTRPSILDPSLESEPWIDRCPCSSDKLCLYLHNHPIAIILGTALDGVALSSRLSQLRHRNPRQ
jgi:hypothetical protein